MHFQEQCHVKTEKYVYFVGLYQKRGVFFVFFVIVQSRSCVLRASAGQEVQLRGSKPTYN